MADLTGMTISPYRIIEQIGRGGMATVYKAYHAAMDRHVAIKILPEEYADDPGFRARFEREAKTVANLRHPHILPVFDYGEKRGISYLVMPYIPTGTLKTYLAQEGQLPLDEAARIFIRLAEALDYAHRQGVIHRDIKPDNVLFDEDGNALLTDFGLTRMVEGGGSLTGTGVIGTPAYMSPEQGQGMRLDHRSDIYSLGIILYEMVTGDVPFNADTPVAVIFKHVSEPLPMPRSQRPDLPESAENVILKSLAKEPEQRWDTCVEMAQAFARAIAGQSANQEDEQMTAVGIQSDISDSSPDVDTHMLPSAPKKTTGGDGKWIFALITIVVVAIIALVASGALAPGEEESTPTATQLSAYLLTSTAITNQNLAAMTAVAGTQFAEAVQSWTPTPTETQSRSEADVKLTATSLAQTLQAPRNSEADTQLTVEAEMAGLITEDAQTVEASWTDTPTPDLRVTAAAHLTATAELWTDTPMPTLTPTDTLTFTPTNTLPPTNTPTSTITHTPTVTATLIPTLQPISGEQIDQVTEYLRLEGSGYSRSIESIAISPDGMLVAAGSSLDVYLWEVASGQQRYMFEGDGGFHMAFSPDGTMLATGGYHDLVVWEVATGQILRRIDLLSYGGEDVAFSPNSSMLAFTDTRTVQVIDVSTGQILYMLDSTNWMDEVVWHPDGTTLISSGWGNPVTLWDLVTSEVLREMYDSEAYAVTSLAFSPDGSLLAASTGDGQVWIEDVTTGQSTSTLGGEGGEFSLNSVAFSPDGSMLVTGGQDNKVKVWDATTGELLHTLVGHIDDVNSVAFSPSGSYIVSGAADGTVRVWGIPGG
jgi:serine/threonine protein kinase